jgi:hypothetical protein
MNPLKALEFDMWHPHLIVRYKEVNHWIDERTCIYGIDWRFLLEMFDIYVYMN